MRVCFDRGKWGFVELVAKGCMLGISMVYPSFSMG